MSIVIRWHDNLIDGPRIGNYAIQNQPTTQQVFDNAQIVWTEKPDDESIWTVQAPQ